MKSRQTDYAKRTIFIFMRSEDYHIRTNELKGEDVIGRIVWFCFKPLASSSGLPLILRPLGPYRILSCDFFSKRLINTLYVYEKET